MKLKKAVSVVPMSDVPVKQAPAGLPNPKDFHPSLPSDFFSRNYCKELAHQELAAYIDQVKSDAKLHMALKTLYTTKGPLGAGHSNAITLWVYAGFPLEHLDLDGVEDISFADLSGAKIKHVIISKDHFTDIEGVSFVGAEMDDVTVLNSNSHQAIWGIPQLQGLERIQRLSSKNRFFLLSPKSTYRIMIQANNEHTGGLELFQVYDYHTGDHKATLLGTGNWPNKFSPDEKLVVCDERNKDHTYFVLKLDEQKGCVSNPEILARKIHYKITPIGDYVPTVTAFSPDSQKLAVAFVHTQLDSGPVPLLGYMIIRVYDTQTWQVEMETKPALVHKNGLEFFDNNTLMCLNAVDKTGVKNQLRIWQLNESARLKKSSVIWKDFATIDLKDHKYAIELYTYPSTGFIGIQYKKMNSTDFTQFCFYHFTGKRLVEFNSYPWRFEKHFQRIHQTGQYLLTQMNGTNDLMILSTTVKYDPKAPNKGMVHRISFDWPRCADKIEFKPDGKGLSFIRLKEPSRRWQYDEQFFLDLPLGYLSNRALHSYFETKFNNRTVRVGVPDAQQFNRGLGFAHLPDHTVSAVDYFTILEKAHARPIPGALPRSSESPDDTGSSESPPDKQLFQRPTPSAPPAGSKTLAMYYQNSPKPSAPRAGTETRKLLIQDAPPIPPKTQATAAAVKRQPVAAKPLTYDSLDFKNSALLGKGGFGYVKSALWQDKNVAVKFIPPNLIDEKSFRDEVTMMLRLDDVHIVKCYGGTSSPEGQFCLVMEQINGGNLAQRLLDKDLWNSALRSWIGLEVATGIRVLHSNNVIHRDLKPENLLISVESHPSNHAQTFWRVKITDFGVSRQLQQGKTHHTTQHLSGTVAYLAPELLAGNATITTAVDIYSFGIIYCEVMAGNRPFSEDSGSSLMSKTAPTPQIPKQAKLCEDAMRLMVRCWSQRADARPSAAEVELATHAIYQSSMK